MIPRLRLTFKSLVIFLLIATVLSPSKADASRSDVEAFVSRFYQTCLGRAPDTPGLDGWVNALLNETLTGSDVAFGFVFSPEFVNKGTTNDDYLQVLYEAFFNRQPDAVGFRGWLDALNGGASRDEVLNGFIRASEFTYLCDAYNIRAYSGHFPYPQRPRVMAFVTRFYQLCLDRNPDAAGLNQWTENLLNRVQTGEDVAHGFIDSVEFVNKNTTHDGYLGILYQAFFNRNPDPAGYTGWLSELIAGKGRGIVLDGFLYSKEFFELCLEYGISPYTYEGTVTIKGRVDDGSSNSPLPEAKCRFVDFAGRRLSGARTDEDGNFTLDVPVEQQGYIRCHHPEVRKLKLATYISTIGQSDGDEVIGENLTPGTTVVTDIIESEELASPETRKARKAELLADIKSDKDPKLSLLVNFSERLYKSLLRKKVDVEFGGRGEGDNGGDGDGGGGAGGEAGDGADFSPIAKAQCDFALDLEGAVLYSAALEDFRDCQLDRPDLAAVKAEVETWCQDPDTRQAFKEAFDQRGPEHVGKPIRTEADEKGKYFLPIPPGIQGFVRCAPADQPGLRLATVVPELQEDEILSGQHVTPATTAFSAHIAPKLDGDLGSTKKNFLDHIEGLRVGYTQQNGDITGFEVIDPETYLADEETDAGVGLVAFSATSLFNIFYKNETDVDYLAALGDFMAKRQVNPIFLVDELGLSAAEAQIAEKVVNTSVITAESPNVLDTDLETAVSTARIKAKVTDRPGGAGIAGAEVDIADIPSGVACECDLPVKTNAAGEVLLTLTGVHETEAMQIEVQASSVAGFQPTTRTVKVVAFATVDLEIAFSYLLTVQGAGNGKGTVTSAFSGIGCDIDAGVTSGDDSQDYDFGTEITLTAEPMADSLFEGWSGGGCSGTGDCTVTMNQAHTVMATFSLKETPCTYSISPLNQSFTAAGGTGSIDVSASASDCSWTATASEPWITIISGSSESGNGTVGYTVSANTGKNPRTAVIMIAGKSHSVTQEQIPDTIAPTVTITAPTSASTYETSSSSLTIGGTASDNVGVTQVTWANSRGGSGTFSGTTSWSQSGISLSSGTNVIAVTARDAAGNTGSDSLTVTYTPPDTTDPIVTISTPTSASTYETSSSSLTIAGTASDNVGVTQVTWTNDRGGSGTCSGTTSWSQSGISLSSGTNVIVVTARDAAGNTRSDTLTVTYTPPDTTRPSVRITSPTSDSTYQTDSSSLTIAGTASDNVGVTQVTWTNDRGGSGTFSGTTSWSQSGISFFSGINVITVTARDAAGNTGSDSLTVTYTPPDTTDPIVTISTPTPASTYETNSSSLTIEGTASDNVGVTQVTWTNDRGGSGTCSGTTSWSQSGISLSSGTNVIAVTARDAAGNTGSDSLTVTYTPPDTTDPIVTITTPTSASTYETSSSSLTIEGTASDNVGVTQVTWTNDRGGSGTCSGTTSWSQSGISLSSGTNVIVVTARDAAGNTRSDTLTVTYTPPDTTRPSVRITSPTSDSTYETDSSSLTIEGTASDNVGVTQVTWTNDRGGSGTCSGTTSWSQSGISLSSGTNVIVVTARDAAGNTRSDTLTVTYTPPDTTRPSVRITSPTSDSTYETDSSSLTIAGTASDNVGVTQVTWANDYGPGGTCSGTTSWSQTGVPLFSGENLITVTARDAAGNTRSDTITVTYGDLSPTISSLSQESTPYAGDCYDYPGAPPRPGTIFPISFNYNDPDGDGHVDDGAKVDMGFDITPWSTFSGNGFSGSVTSRRCITFDGATSSDITASLTDGGGHDSNSLTINIPRPAGAD